MNDQLILFSWFLAIKKTNIDDESKHRYRIALYREIYSRGISNRIYVYCSFCELLVP